MTLRLSLLACALLACSTPSPTDNPDVNAPPVVTPPTIACSPPPPDGGCDDAGDSGDDAACDGGPVYYYDKCTLPPSVCADSHWAAYFDDGVCVNGTCELVTKYHYCDTGCSGGACISNRSTAPSRGF
jgi:hypothetical protein